MKKICPKNNHKQSKFQCQKDKIQKSLFEVENFLDTFESLNDIFKIAKILRKKRP